ncbi:MAG: thermonuclease family protein [Magnetococcales bacterium]|nr:thermonuclease family protein [Magnetococcales bacterium]
MHPKYIFLVGLFILFALLGPAFGDKKSYGDIEGVVYLGNYDGDTVRFNLPGVHPLIGQNISVRIRGIDTPEIRGECLAEIKLAKQAKVMLGQLLDRAGRITLKEVGRGKYFRIVAYVVADGVDVSYLLNNSGLAVGYDGGVKSGGWCAGYGR